MKVLVFPSYNREDRDDVGRPPVQARAWYIAFAAVSQAPAGPNADSSAKVHKLYGAFKSLMVVEGTGDDQKRFLNPFGGQILLEDGEIKALQGIVDGFRANVSGAGSDALVYLDTLITTAPESPRLLA